MTFDESSITLSSKSKALKNWFLELKYSTENEKAISEITTSQIQYSYFDNDYSLLAKTGIITETSKNTITIKPIKKNINLILK